MLVRRLSLLWVFAGGCLSGALIIGVWRGDAKTPPTPRKQDSLERVVAQALTAPVATTPPVATDTAPEHALSDDAKSEPAAAKDTQDRGDASTAEPGSSVADVLLALEANYRQQLAAANVPAPTPPPATNAPVAAPTPEVPAREAATTLAVAVAPTPTPTPTPPKAAPPTEARPTGAPEANAEPVLASRDQTPARAVHVGDVHQNTHIGNVHQGDVYLLQQLQYLQNIQLFGVVPEARSALPPRGTRGLSTRRTWSDPTAIMNPDNPWGFDFSPTILVK